MTLASCKKICTNRSKAVFICSDYASLSQVVLNFILLVEMHFVPHISFSIREDLQFCAYKVFVETSNTSEASSIVLHFQIFQSELKQDTVVSHSSVAKFDPSEVQVWPSALPSLEISSKPPIQKKTKMFCSCRVLATGRFLHVLGASFQAGVLR
ncbi:hypothetical protein ABZP36_008489 [Zizania latifolia]